MVEDRAVIAYLKENNINHLDVADKYLIKDTGKGFKLVKWDIDIAEPTLEQLEVLNAVEIAKEEVERNKLKVQHQVCFDSNLGKLIYMQDGQWKEV